MERILQDEVCILRSRLNFPQQLFAILGEDIRMPLEQELGVSRNSMKACTNVVTKNRAKASNPSCKVISAIRCCPLSMEDLLLLSQEMGKRREDLYSPLLSARPVEPLYRFN